MSPLSSREPDLIHMESGGNVNHVTHVSENVTCGAGLGQRDSAACWRREQTPDSWGRTRVSQTGSRTGQQVLHFIYALRVLLSGDTDEQYYNSFNLLTDCSYFAVSKHFNQRCLGQPYFREDRLSPPFGGQSPLIPFRILLFHSLFSLFLILPLPCPPRSVRSRSPAKTALWPSPVGSARQSPGRNGILVYLKVKKCVW